MSVLNQRSHFLSAICLVLFSYYTYNLPLFLNIVFFASYYTLCPKLSDSPNCKIYLTSSIQNNFLRFFILCRFSTIVATKTLLIHLPTLCPYLMKNRHYMKIYNKLYNTLTQ